MDLKSNVHLGLALPSPNAKFTLIKGNYDYYHYFCDGIDDRGWGCGYRTLQTICSWIKEQQLLSNIVSKLEVPSIQDIQRALVKIGDKNDCFIGSKQWIGSLEVSYCIDHFYDVRCRILHFRSVDDLKEQASAIENHFKEYGSPIMMGGDKDCSSKGILGISENENGLHLLVLDPHFMGKNISKETLQKDGWIQWKKIQSLDSYSFYNLCCPLIKATVS